MKARACELCTETAALYCASDSAYLCWNCDARVHGANFLVARHLRRTICAECEGFDGNCISGVVIRPYKPVCRSCSSEDDADSISSSSACVSSTESFATSPKKVDFDRRDTDITSSSLVTGITVERSDPVRISGESASSTGKNGGAKTKKRTKALTRSRAPAKVDGRTEGVLVNWCRMLGMNGNLSVRVASHAFGLCSNELTTALPFRVALASAFWFSLRLRGDRAAFTYQNLRRLEEVSGVSAKLIVAAEAKLARALRDRKARRDDQEEGWAECSV